MSIWISLVGTTKTSWCKSTIWDLAPSRGPGCGLLNQCHTLSWAGDHRRIAVCTDDSGRAGEAPGIAKLGVPVPHGDNRMRKDADRGTNGGDNQRTTEGFKLRGTNQYPTIVGLIHNQPFNYLGVINSTLQLNQSIRMSTYGLNLHLLQQLGLRLASSCDTQCHGTPFHMFNTMTMDYEPYVNNLKDGNFNLLRAYYFFSPHQQYDYYGRRVAHDGCIISTTWHPVCLTTECQCHFNALKNQVTECTNCQQIDFNSNLANCRWRIGTQLFWTTTMFNTIPIADHRNSHPRRCPTYNDLLHSVTQSDAPLSGGRSS